MDIADITLNAAYVAWVATAYTRRLPYLRTLLIFASLSFVAYGLIEEIWPIVMWNAVIVVTHVYRIVREWQTQQAVTLTADEAAIRDRILPDLGDYDFNLLWSMGETTEFDNEVMIEQGTRPEVVHVVLDGLVTIRRNSEVIREMGSGTLLGEMSFVSGEPARVSASATGIVHTRCWDQRQLRSLEHTNPPSARAFRELIARDLVTKVAV